MRKTQPPKSPRKRGFLLNLPDWGHTRGQGVRNDEYWFFAQSAGRSAEVSELIRIILTRRLVLHQSLAMIYNTLRLAFRAGDFAAAADVNMC